MTKVKYNIMVWGLLSTGSSALICMLNEYRNISIIPNEFDDYRAPGLVADQLKEHRDNELPNMVNALCTYKKKLKLIYKIIPILDFVPNAFSNMRQRYKTNITKIKSLNLLYDLNKQLVKTDSLGEKIKLTNKWIKANANIYSSNKEFVVFNQAVSPANDTNIWKEVFRPFKLICVYRDPKDQLAEIIKKGYLFAPYGAPYMNHGGLVLESIYGRSRESALQFHIQAIKKRMEWIDRLILELPPEELLVVDFEGLALNDNLYRTIIEKFIGEIDNNDRSQNLYFNTQLAIRNIGIYKKYLQRNEYEHLYELDNWYQNMIKNHSPIERHPNL